MSNRINAYNGSRMVSPYARLRGKVHTSLGNGLGVAAPVAGGLFIASGTAGPWEIVGIAGATALVWSERRLAASRLHRKINQTLVSSGIYGYSISRKDAWQALMGLGHKKPVRLADIYVKHYNGHYFMSSASKGEHRVETTLTLKRSKITVDQKFYKTKLKEWDDAVDAFDSMYGITPKKNRLEIKSKS